MKGVYCEEGSWFDRQVSSSFLFITGLFLAPAIIIQDKLILKLFQTLMFMGLTRLTCYSRQRSLIWGSLIFFLTTLVFNLLSPLGRVIVKIGPFIITEGALVSGLSKGFTVLSLVYLSRFCVRNSIILTGAVGRYLSKTLFYLNCLVQEKKLIRITGKDVIKSLDTILDNVYNNNKYNVSPGLEKNNFVGVLFLLTLLFINWGFVFFL